MSSALVRRQKVRRALLVISFALFPVTLNYFSPYLIVDSAAHGIVNGSLLMFAGMSVGSLVLGRAWCGWLCPAGGLQEMLQPVNGRRAGKRADLVKWVIWVPWLALIVAIAVRVGGYHTVEPLYGTVGGLSLAGDAERPVIAAYAVYFGVVALFATLAMTVGRRGGCHSVCWMAPFMITGRSARNALRTPALQLASDASACSACGTCTSACPTGLDVRALVAAGSVEHPECTLCATCADSCPSGAIGYSFGRPRP